MKEERKRERKRERKKERKRERKRERESERKGLRGGSFNLGNGLVLGDDKFCYLDLQGGFSQCV